MDGVQGAGGAGQGGASPPPADPPPVPAPPTRADRILLGAFAVYVLLILTAAFAQLTDNRALLDLFDLRRFFTR